MGNPSLGPKLGILLELSSKEGPGCVGDLVIRIARRTVGALNMSSSTIHLTLGYLIKDGIVLKSPPRSIESRRRAVCVYSLTSEGLAMAEAHRGALSGWMDLKLGAKRLKAALTVMTTV